MFCLTCFAKRRNIIWKKFHKSDEQYHEQCEQAGDNNRTKLSTKKGDVEPDELADVQNFTKKEEDNIKTLQILAVHEYDFPNKNKDNFENLLPHIVLENSSNTFKVADDSCNVGYNLASNEGVLLNERNLNALVKKKSALSSIELQLQWFSDELHKISLENKKSDAIGQQDTQLSQSVNYSTYRQKILQSVVKFAGHAQDELKKLTKVAQDSAKNFECIWKEKSSSLPLLKHDEHGSERTQTETDKNQLELAEQVLEVAGRLLSLAKAEQTLTLFLASHYHPFNRNDLQNGMSHIKRAVSNISATFKIADADFTDDETSVLLLKSISRFLSELFPCSIITQIKNAAAIKLAELEISCADIESQTNALRYDLNQAVLSRSEKNLKEALQRTSDSSIFDLSKEITNAQEELSKLRDAKEQSYTLLAIAIKENDVTQLETALQNSANLYLPPTSSVILEANEKLKDFRFKQKRKDLNMLSLEEAAQTRNISKLRITLATAKELEPLSRDLQIVKGEAILNYYRCALHAAEICARRNANHTLQLCCNNALTTSSDDQNDLRLETKDLKINLCEYLNVAVENMRTYTISVTEFDNLRQNLHLITHSDLKIPNYLISNVEDGIRKVLERQRQVQDFRQNLSNAVSSQSLVDLLNVIKSAGISSELLHFNVDGKSEYTHSLLAMAKEKLSAVNAKNKKGNVLITDQASEARHNLKKVMHQNADDVLAVRAAMDTFRTVCGVEEKAAAEANKIRGKVNTRKKSKARRIRKVKSGLAANSETRKAIRNLKKGAEGTQQHQAKECKSQTQGVSFSALTANVVDMSFENQSTLEKSPLETIETAGVEALDRDRKKCAVVDCHRQRLVTVETWPNDNHIKNSTLLNKAQKLVDKLEKSENKRAKEAEATEALENIKHRLSTEIQNAIKTDDRAELWRCTHRLSRLLGDDLDDECVYLKNEALKHFKVLTTTQCNKDLQNAVAKRDLDKLEHVLYQIENNLQDLLPTKEENRNMFLKDFHRGQQLASRLKEIQSIRDGILSMTRMIISEICSYPSPPTIVHSVMAATYLLLGECKRTVEDWSKVHSLIGMLGRLSLSRRIKRCRACNISLQSAKNAQLYLKDLTFERVKKISTGASKFYAWATLMTNEVLDLQADENHIVQETTN
ncbi:unnamed protein product [Clavelina lepadiformis]|uniref:Uncharacterized protein n=2 Tax=Clavelina lepadiformis TaxID=159417 RepID=A0ABP0EYU1_CLALP